MIPHLSRAVAVAIIVTVTASIANCSKVAFAVVNLPTWFGSFERRADLPYGSDPRQRLDVYAPVGAVRRPIVVFWYGGAWVRGTKEQYRFVGAALARAGYVAILPDYRLFPQSRFPAFVEDGAQAVQWAHDHAGGFGGDPHALFLMGHSAGAYIASTLALEPRYLRKVGGSSAWIRGWIGLSGPYALELRTPGLHEIFREPYSATDWRPVAFVNGRSPPALLVHGSDDTLVHPLETVDLAQRLGDAGTPVECRIYPYSSHQDTVAALSPTSLSKAPTSNDVRGFIERTVAGEAVRTPCPQLRLRREWSPGQPVSFNGG